MTEPSTHHKKPPLGLRWRSHSVFIATTVCIGQFADLFLFGLIVPVLPFLLEDQFSVPEDKVQALTSNLLAAFAGASVVFAPVAGILSDRAPSRQGPFLAGLLSMFAGTILLYIAQDIYLLFLARILQGFSGATIWSVGLALLKDTVEPQNLGKTVGTVFSISSSAAIFGPVVGGILYDKVGYAGVFWVGIALLTVDLIMRLLVIEKRFLKEYDGFTALPTEPAENAPRSHDGQQESNEETPLLPGQIDCYEIKDGRSGISKFFPLALCFKNASLLASFGTAFMQAFFVGAFDSTVPLEAKSLFGFSTLTAGLLFIPFGVGDIVIGPVAGWAVDRFGTRPVAGSGFAYLVPVFAALRFVRSGGNEFIALYGVLLALSGFGIACFSAASIVESGTVVENYHRANPGLFGENGPFGQLYSMNVMLFSAGLAFGPLIAGWLRESIGYGNMNAVLAALSLLTSACCFVWMGQHPKSS